MKPFLSLAAALAVLTIALAWISPTAQAATPKCFGLEATIIGDNSTETLNGTPGNDVIVGQGGNDTINGRGGDDLICGGAGVDKLYGHAGNDKLNGGLSSDSCYGGAGVNALVSCGSSNPPPPPPPPPGPNCDPNHGGGCVPVASDVDCGGGSGNGPVYIHEQVTVIGSDIYGLDSDGDGIGCDDLPVGTP